MTTLFWPVGGHINGVPLYIVSRMINIITLFSFPTYIVNTLDFVNVNFKMKEGTLTIRMIGMIIVLLGVVVISDLVFFRGCSSEIY